jgi:hypothetical protein
MPCRKTDQPQWPTRLRRRRLRANPDILFSRFALRVAAPPDFSPDDLDIIAPHVDATFYRGLYPDIARQGLDPATHYLCQGWCEGRNPNAWFDSVFYLQRYPDVADSGMNPLLHYIRHGRAEGRDCRPPNREATGEPQYANPELATVAEAMDLVYYRGIYPDIDLPGLDPVEHFHRAGWREGRKPNPWFDPAYYLRTYPDVARANIDPLLHYLRHGRREGRNAMAPGGARRATVDAARPPAERPLGYDTPDPAPFLAAPDLQERLSRATIGAGGLVLAVSHDRYIDLVGGVQLFIADEQSLFNGDRFTYLHLAPAVARLTIAPPGGPPSTMQVVIDGAFAGLTTYATLERVLEALPPDAPPVRIFVVHSIFGHRVADLAALAGKMRPSACCFWLHDYATICEGYNLLRDDVEFCHAPALTSAACSICVYGASRRAYLDQVRSLFDAVTFDVLAPSRAALDLWLRTADLPHRTARVHRHGVFRPAAANTVPLMPATADPRILREPARVAFVGYPLAQKGWPLFMDLFAAAQKLGPYRFYHFRKEGNGMPMTGLVSVTAQADRHDRSGMIEALTEHAIELVLALSPWPETFSYVVHEAFAAGADVVALACSSNVADLVRARERGVVLRDRAALLRFFMELDAARYVMAQRAVGRQPGRFVLTGTTATYDPAAGGAGKEPLTTPDPALCIIANGSAISAERDGDCYRFDLPAGTSQVRVVSRFVPPVALCAGADRRRVGAAISRISLDGETVPIGDARRAAGWHPPRTAGTDWQLTDGDAILLTDGAGRLDIVAEPKVRYRRSPIGARAG